MFETKIPPNSREAERAIVGTLMRDSWLVPEVVRVLGSEEFYSLAHRNIFDAVVTLADGGKQPDLVAIAEYLLAKKQLDDCGGHLYLAELYAEVSSINVMHHAEIVRNYATKRDVIRACADLNVEAWDVGIQGPELLESADKRIAAIADRGVVSEVVTLQQAISEAYDRLDRRRAMTASDGVPSGLIDLDKLTLGFQASELTILAARPSLGKTACGLQVASYAAIETGEPVLFVSLEQARIELAERFICSHSRVDSHRLRKGHLTTAEMDAVVSAGEKFGSAPLWIDDKPGQTMMRIAASARRIKQRHGLKMVVIDYLQLIESDSAERRASRQEQVSAISRRLKLLARELKVPVIALAQLNRGVEERAGGRPRLSDLRESGSIEQDADVVILMHRQDDGGPVTAQIDLLVAKNRSGPTGDVSLLYVKSQMRFENFSIDHEARAS